MDDCPWLETIGGSTLIESGVGPTPKFDSGIKEKQEQVHVR
jgi:hypothetical protein